MIEIDINRKPVCDFLLVTDILSRTVSEISQLIVQNVGHFAFLSHTLGGLGTTYDVHLGLIGKRVVDFLLVLTEVFFARCYG